MKEKELDELSVLQEIGLLPWETQKKWYRSEKQRWEDIERHVLDMRQKYPESGKYYEELWRQRKQQLGALSVAIREKKVKKVLNEISPAYHPAQTTFE